MRVKWKCVWKVLKPKIIAALIVIMSALMVIGIGILVLEYYMNSIPSPDYANMSLYQQQSITASCGCGGFGIMPLIGGILIIFGGIGIIYLSIEYLRALAEALKPCIILKEGDENE